MSILRAAPLLACMAFGVPAWAQGTSVTPRDLSPHHAPDSIVRDAARVAVWARLQQPQQQEEFTPISELPPQQQLPAAPLLIGAYAFVLVTLFGYVFSISRRLNGIQREVDQLETELKRNGRS